MPKCISQMTQISKSIIDLAEVKAVNLGRVSKDKNNNYVVAIHLMTSLGDTIYTYQFTVHPPTRTWYGRLLELSWDDIIASPRLHQKEYQQYLDLRLEISKLLLDT